MEGEKIYNQLEKIIDELDRLSNETVYLGYVLEGKFFDLIATYKLIREEEGDAWTKESELPKEASKLFVEASEKFNEADKFIIQLQDLCQRLLDTQRGILKKEEGK